MEPLRSTANGPPSNTLPLLRGERYKSIAFTQTPPSRPLLISYDIMCQWKIATTHRASHNTPCQYTMRAVARTDGEGVERFWSSAMVVKRAQHHNHLFACFGPKRSAPVQGPYCRKHTRKHKHTFRVGNVRAKQGDQAIHFLPNHRGTRSRLVNVEPANRRRLAGEASDTFGSWSPMEQTGWEDSGIADEVEAEAAPARRRYVSSDDPMRLWRRQIPSYLDELLRSEGLGRHWEHPTCDVCGADGLQLFRCRTCGQFLQCETCLRERHQQQPLHRPEVWNGDFWAPCSLFRDSTAAVELAMVYQLGHHGFECSFPAQRSQDRPWTLTVMDHGGIFKVDVRFCGCSDSLRHPHGHLLQLMDNGWYPATTIEPSTCATYALLEHFRLLKVVANVNANDFVRTLERLTDATHTKKVADRYKSFIRMSRQWDFLTRRNMPDGWEDAAEDEAFRHSLLLAMDANFRLKNHIRANERHDPSLGQGLGYFVPTDAYKYFLRHYVAEEDVSTCIAFAALMQKETQLTTGLRVSGVGRYANMDWILLSAVDGIGVKRLVLSYDIASEHLEELAEEEGWEDEERGPAIRTELGKYRVQFGLPVWHAAAHEASCQAANSLSHAVGVGRTDGEGIERTWAILNPISYSTKEMGEGHRHDTIDDKVDHINFEKNVKEGDSLARKLIIALAECDRQMAEFVVVDASVSPANRIEWLRRIDKWIADPSAPNPYMMDGKHAGPTEGQILADLKKAELEDVRAGRGEAMIGKMTGVAFIKAGLQLQDLQRRIRAEVKATVTMTADRAGQLDELRVSFFKKLRNWETHQSVFMPTVEDMRAEEEERRDRDVAPPLAEDTKLWLPSDLTNDQRRRGCRRGLIDAELRLREGQCGDALCKLRGYLQAKHHLIDHRNTNAVGQLASTRSNTLIGRINVQGQREMTKYRDARRAGLELKPTFCPHFQVLNDDDARVGVEVESDAAARAALGRAGTSARVRNEPAVLKVIKPVTWIWSVGGDPDAQELHDSVRVQWTKVRARRDRWVEEVEILREEMRRVLRSLETVQREWQARAEGRTGGDAELAAGARAYAKRQQAIYQRIAGSFKAQWSTSAAEAVRRVVSEGAEDADDDDVEPEDGEEQGGQARMDVDGPPAEP
ncbi:hypothetical protein C8F01DRAFT_1280798 [Mycena amicta]|nr:hypothetical protein C8F01DRAFT_1280798 [Mycena amicta]